MAYWQGNVSNKPRRNISLPARAASSSSSEDILDEVLNGLDFDAEESVRSPFSGNGTILTRGDGFGKTVTFKHEAFLSRGSGSEESSTRTGAMRSVSSPIFQFGERDWTRKAHKRKYGSPVLGPTLGHGRPVPPTSPLDHPHRGVSGRQGPGAGLGSDRQPAHGGQIFRRPPSTRLGSSGLLGRQPAQGTRRRRDSQASSSGSKLPRGGTTPWSQPGKDRGSSGGVLPGQVSTPPPPPPPPPAASSSTPPTSTTPKLPSGVVDKTGPEIVPPAGPGAQPTPAPLASPSNPSSSTGIIHPKDPKDSQSTTKTGGPLTAQPVAADSVPPTAPTMPTSAPTQAPVAPAMPAVPINPANPVLKPDKLYMLAAIGQSTKLRDPLVGVAPGVVPSDHIVFAEKNTSSQEFLRSTGPLIFEKPLDPAANTDASFELSSSDKMRRSFNTAWMLQGNDNSTKPAATSYLQSLVVTVKPTADKKAFRINNVQIKVAKDNTSVPLLFSAQKDILNQEFEVGFEPSPSPSPAATSTVTAAAPPTIEATPGSPVVNPEVINTESKLTEATSATSSERVKAVLSTAPQLSTSSPSATVDVKTLSGIERYPGHLILGLENGSSADGGFKTLSDLCILAGITPKTWLKVLLSTTEVKLGSLVGTPAHNAVWYLPESDSMCCIRLEGSVSLDSKIMKYLEKYLSGWKDKIPHISVIAKRNVSPPSDPRGKPDIQGELVLAVEPAIVAGEPRALGIYVSILEDTVSLMLVCYSTNLQWGFLRDWLKQNCSEVSNALEKLQTDLHGLAPGTTTQGSAKDLDHIYWRKVTVTLASESDKTVLAGLSLELEASVQLLVPEDKHSVFAMTFSWDKASSEFKGRCLFNGSGGSISPGNPPVQYMVDYERWDCFPYLVKSEDFMSLRYIDSTLSDHIPYGVPTEIVYADLTISNTTLSFKGNMRSILGKKAVTPLPASDSQIPSLQLDHVDLSISLDLDYAKTPKSFKASLGGGITLLPFRPGDMAATIGATIAYNSAESVWSFDATAKSLRMTVLHSLFTPGAERTHAMNILENITLNDLYISYKHSKGLASQVNFKAEVKIASVVLTTSFIRQDTANWGLTATLHEDHTVDSGQSAKDFTLGEAVQKLLGNDVSDLLPEFIKETKLTLANPTENKFTIDCKRINDPECLIFGAELKFGMLHVHFAQIASIAEKSNGNDGKTDNIEKTPVKRLIRVSLGPLPSIPKLPVVGDLDIPFDALEFLWTSTAITEDEVNIMNLHLGPFKEQALGLANGDKELLKGYHFRLVGNKGVFLDHIFDHKPKPSEKTQGAAVSPGGLGDGDKSKGSTQMSSIESKKSSDSSTQVAATEGGSAATTTAPISTKRGPLKLSGIGLSYEEGNLKIHLDADVLIGPIGAGVQGLTLTLDLSHVKGLHDLLHVPIHAQIEGFDMSFDRSPVMLAGALHHKPNTKEYFGGIAISLKALSIAALGMYDQVPATQSPPTPAYDSFFVYAMLEGLIFTVGWAEIRGLIAGFGYNSRLRLPSAEQLSTFPFLTGFSTPGGFNIDNAVKKLTGPDAFVTPSQGSLWMALGLIIRACEVIDMQAVATLALGSNQTEIGLLARATAALPRGSPPDKALVLIDLSVIGKLDLVHGELSVDGLINPTSFILSKDCRPSGGFAIRSWFGKGNAHEGDWVVTFGGYHPSYQVPAHYPVPPRLGISWTLNSNLRVTGNAYAAITPGAIMAGGLLQAVFAAGPLGAHFDAHADFLVNLKPLHYEADMGVFAGVYYEIRVWCLRKKISVEVGASLHLEGPPVHGRVHFDLTVVSFNVNFGDKNGDAARSISLVELMELVLQNSADNRNAKGVIQNPHTFNVISGMVGDDVKKGAGAEAVAKKNNDNKDSGAKEPWVVRSDNFLFQVRSPVPLSTATVEYGSNANTNPKFSGNNIISRPMHMRDHNAGGIDSSFSVKVCHAGTIQALPFQAVSQVYDQLPANYWGQYSDNPRDYMRPNVMPPTVEHFVGLTLVPPPAVRPHQSIPVFTSIEEKYEPGEWKPVDLEKKTTRYVDDNGARDSIKWSRVRGAMAMPSEPVVSTTSASTTPRRKRKQTVITREDILSSFIELAHPGKDAQSRKAQDAYRRVGSNVPRVVLQEPERFYVSPPTVFCN